MWGRKRRIKKLVCLCEQYLTTHYVRPAYDDSVRYSVEESLDTDNEPEVRYSRRTDVFDFDEQSTQYHLIEKPEYSLKDNYDSGSIQRAMRNMTTATPISRVLKTLDEHTNMTFLTVFIIFTMQGDVHFILLNLRKREVCISIVAMIIIIFRMRRDISVI